MNENNTVFIFEDIEFDSNIVVLSKKFIIPDIDIANEKRLLVVGNFIKKREDIALIEEMASKINFTVCCSRRVVERGILPQSRQIGLSGKLVSPEIMITLGVSGSVQFMAGVKKVKKLIAVNNDEKARIFNYAHYPILGDAYEIIPELLHLVNEEL
jgi:electron transfer flavoprotein alpha subunit